MGAVATRAILGELTSYSKRLYARLPKATCLLARGTRLAWIAFHLVNGLCPASQGKVYREKIVARVEIILR